MRRFILLLGLLLPLAARAAGLPHPPCPAPPDPPYAAVDAAPHVQAWHVDRWTPPACLGWASAGSTLLVTLAGSFRHAGTAEDLVAQFGAVSTLRGIKYWSSTDRRWLTFITDAAALRSSNSAQRRDDFSAAELARGQEVYFTQSDSRSSTSVIYRMRVLEDRSDRVVITIVNVTPIRLFLIPVFSAGDVQTTYFLQPLSPGVWGYYTLWGARTGLLTSGHDGSSINRAVAVFRHFAGIPTDREPPAAP